MYQSPGPEAAPLQQMQTTADQISSNIKPVWEHFSGSTPSWIFVAKNSYLMAKNFNCTARNSHFAVDCVAAEKSSVKQSR